MPRNALGSATILVARAGILAGKRGYGGRDAAWCELEARAPRKQRNICFYMNLATLHGRDEQ